MWSLLRATDKVASPHKTDRKIAVNVKPLQADCNETYCHINSCKWPTWRTILFSIYLFQFYTCFEQPRAHHQENQFYQYNIWYVSLCVGDCLVCRSGRNFPTCILDGHLHLAIWPSSSRITTTCSEQDTEVQAVFRVPVGTVYFFPSKSPDRFWGQATHLFLLRLQRLWRASDHPPLVPRLRGAGAIPPFTHCVRGLHSDRFTISFTLCHFLSVSNKLIGDRGSTVVKVLRYKSKGVIGIFHSHNPSDRTMALGSTQPPTELSTSRIFWG
jgi:hypothetical protein